MPNSDYTQQNRRAWNEIASVRSTVFPGADFFAQGGSTLDDRAVQAARQAAGDLTNLRVIHLQCATGEDTLSWATLGAEAAGVDISDEQITIAREKARAAGLPVRFFASDIYDLPGSLPTEVLGDGFDFVFTGGGAIVWLPDLMRWAETVAALLRPGGRLLLIDEHPLASCLWVEEGKLKIAWDYFSRAIPDIAKGWSHFPGGENAQEQKYEFNWPLGDIVTAAARAGLIVEKVEEFPGGPAWRFGDKQEEALQIPGEFLLVARKETAAPGGKQ